MPLLLGTCPPAGDSIPGKIHRGLEGLPRTKDLPDSVLLKDRVAAFPSPTVLGFSIDSKQLKLFGIILKVYPHRHQRH